MQATRIDLKEISDCSTYERGIKLALRTYPDEYVFVCDGSCNEGLVKPDGDVLHFRTLGEYSAWECDELRKLGLGYLIAERHTSAKEALLAWRKGHTGDALWYPGDEPEPCWYVLPSYAVPQLTYDKLTAKEATRQALYRAIDVLVDKE